MSPVELALLQRILLTDAGLNLESGKEYLINGRLEPIAASAGLADVAALVRAVATPGALRRRVVEAMTTNETSFFRDIQPFERTRKEILPEIVAARKGARRLRIWSAACSTGQEPVSLAITVRDHFPELRDWDVRVVGSDFNAQVVERARSGRYTQLEVNRGLPAAALLRHFTRAGLEWAVSADVRALTMFHQQNLLEPSQHGPFDLVFLRNVLIYFTPDIRARVLRRVRAAMAPDAWLLLGAAETSAGVPEGFTRIVRGDTTYLRPAS